MAVKASAHITLHSVVDIEATYRYYLLQSSTLAKPAVPTTNPPDSKWNDAEPTYTAGSTNSLYYVDLTVFSNGTFLYSEVSLSTAYEAAKEAYNKAVAAQGSADSAQEDIDNLEIGGRNLLRYTDVTKHTDEWVAYNSSTLTLTNDYLKIVTNSGSTSGGAYPKHALSLESNTEYTLSFDAYGDAAINLDYCYIMCPDGNTSLGIIVPITTTPGRYTHTFTTTKAYDPYSIMIGIRTSDGVSKTFYVRNLKVEKGNKAIDWTAAPEDTDEDISNAQTSADSNTGRLDNLEPVVVKMENTFSTLVRGENGESLMTQTDDGWIFSMANVLNTLNNATSDIDSLNSDVADANVAIDGLNQAVADLGEYTEYIKFGTDNGQPCIILGETDSNFKVLITNTDIRFMEGSAIPASISNQSLNIEKAVIQDELKQGGFVWMARSNGNYGLIWKGE